MFVEAKLPYCGFEVVVMVNDIGCRCGYVGVPAGHELYGMSYWSIDDLNVHGGLTYSGHRLGDRLFWHLGFDCAHADDSPDPALIADIPECLKGGHVWTLLEVIRECFKLADGILARYQ